MRKYRDIKIVLGAERAQKLINRPTFCRSREYGENMVAFQLRQQKVTLNKPRYIGMTILNLSKIVMYDFHYKFILPEYPGTKLLFTDTDSFCYHIPTEDNLYESIKKRYDWIDFSNYSEDHPNHDITNRMIPGKFKDETAGVPILEFVGLRAKMYSILKVDGKTKSTAKGVSTAVKKNVLKHIHYKECLEKNEIRTDTMTRIMQEKHNLYTVVATKTSLSPFNDKKYIFKDLTTLSFGHYKIEEEDQECINILEDLINSA